MSNTTFMQALRRWFRQQTSWIESQQVSILSAAVIIFVANVASAVAGLIKNRVLSDIYISDLYGKSLDAYWVAFRAPELAYQLIVLGALSAAFIPLFASWYRKDAEKAFEFATQAMLILLAIFTLASLGIALYAREFVLLLTGSKFEQSTELVLLATNMTRIMMIAQMLFGISGFFSAMLQSAKRFIIPAFSPVLYNVGIILVTLFAHQQLGLYAAAWGTVLGAFLHTIIQIPLLWKIGFRIPWPMHWHLPIIREFIQLMLPRTFALLVEQLNLWILTFYATTLSGLSLSLIIFAQQLMTLPIRFFGVSIGQAALPFLADEQDDLVGFRRTVFRSLRQIFFFAAPASVLLLVLRVPAVRLAYGTDDFTWRSTLITAEALGILALSIAPQAATHLLTRAFYALNNTVIPLVASVLYLFITATGCWYLTQVQHWELSGLATALTIASFMESTFLLLMLLAKIQVKEVAPLVSSLLRITFAAFLMAITLFIFQRLLDWYVFETSLVWQLLQLTTVVSLLGGTVYLAFCWLLQIEELTILRRIWNKIGQQWRKLLSQSPEYLGNGTQTE